MNAIARLTLLFFLAVAACGPSDATAPSDLAGTQWWLESMVNAPTPAAAQVPTAVFDAERASGRAGCNTWMGGYQRAGDTLTFTAIGSTKKMCPYGMPYEQAFLNALQRTE